MLRIVVSLLVLVLRVHSLSMYSYKSVYEVFMPDIENNISELDPPEPPPHGEVAKMARFIVHNSDWTVLAYRSLHNKTMDFPVGTILSVSDGPVNESKGTPYVYVTELEDAVQDTAIDSRCSLTMTLAQEDYCRMKKLDPQFPTCAQVWLVGLLQKVANGTEEEAFARKALFSRHPTMASWPKDHHFFFMKLLIQQIAVQDYFGGPVYVDVKDYYNAYP